MLRTLGMLGMRVLPLSERAAVGCTRFDLSYRDIFQPEEAGDFAMTRGGGMGTVFAGIFCSALGIGLTFLGYLLAPPGGVYVVFVGLISSGFLMIFRGMLVPGSTSGKVRSYAPPARVQVLRYVAPPERMPPGYCWQCWRKVRAGKLVCLSCGATQMRA